MYLIPNSEPNEKKQPRNFDQGCMKIQYPKQTTVHSYVEIIAP